MAGNTEMSNSAEHPDGSVCLSLCAMSGPAGRMIRLDWCEERVDCEATDNSQSAGIYNRIDAGTCVANQCTLGFARYIGGQSAWRKDRDGVNSARIIIGIAIAVTLGAVILWQTTGGDYYTKFQVVEEIRSEVDPDDPLAAAGFYEGDTTTQAVTRDEFRFGLLPTPEGVFDKHVVSVASVSGPVWVVAIGFAWWTRRKTKRNQQRGG